MLKWMKITIGTNILKQKKEDKETKKMDQISGLISRKREI